MLERHEGTARMHKAVIYNDTLYLSGQTFPEGVTIEEQAKGVLAKIDCLLKAYGSDRDHVLFACIYLSDMAYVGRFNAIWEDWVHDGHQPARSCVGVQFATDKHMLEIAVTAAII